MSFVNLHKRKILLIIGYAVFVSLLIASYLYYQSDRVKIQADALRDTNPQGAIALYKKAQSIFPLRWDIPGDIAGTQLILQSKTAFDSITDFGEYQQPPPLANLPTTQLAPNELFAPVLMYHHIEINPLPNDPLYAALYVSPDQLDQQLSYLASHNYHTITFDELLSALDKKTTLPQNPIILTFDDGYRSFYENAFPLLKKYHMQAIEFVITQVVGDPAYLTWNQILEMDKSGLVEIGAHTRHHPNLPDLSQAAIVDEVQGSKIDLEQQLKHPVNWFAYPYGSYSPFIIQTVKNAGFKGAASTIYGTNQSIDTFYLSPRIMVDGRFSLDNIARRIQE